MLFLLQTEKVENNDYKNIIKYYKKTIKEIFESETLSWMDKIKLINHMLNNLKNIGISWIPKEIEDEIYNFYGDRFLREK